MAEVCRKNPYTKKHALAIRNLRDKQKGTHGSVYFCGQHNAWHVTKQDSIVSDSTWAKINSNGKL